jgi:hypothetical protein
MNGLAGVKGRHVPFETAGVEHVMSNSDIVPEADVFR